MVKRSHVGLLEIADWSNLSWAFWRAARGKRLSGEVLRFGANLEGELNRIGSELRGAHFPVGRFRSFQIRDPKLRTIHAPVFRERVVHHAMLRWVGPVLDRSLVDATFACRAGRGPLAAVRHVQRLVRRFPWYVKADVRRYFDSVDHAILMALLRRRLANRALLDLIARIVGSYETDSRKGLPIGALTSQHFANFYLGRLDRLLADSSDVLGQARYMDDLVWFCASREEAKRTLERARAFAKAELELELKPDASVQRSDRGVPFCGFRVLPRRLRMSRRRKRRYSAARRRHERDFELGGIRAGELQRGFDSAVAITAHADAWAFRRNELLRHGTLEA